MMTKKTWVINILFYWFLFCIQSIEDIRDPIQSISIQYALMWTESFVMCCKSMIRNCTYPSHRSYVIVHCLLMYLFVCHKNLTLTLLMVLVVFTSFHFVGRGGASIYGKQFDDEISSELKHTGKTFLFDFIASPWKVQSIW